jgi:hypothetical protein
MRKRKRNRCVNEGCNRYAEAHNERCREHSMAYYAPYWGIGALQNLSESEFWDEELTTK